MDTKKNPKIVVIGGGTGSFTLLKELKKHTTNITALVNMADDGGSTGLLRDEFGVLPPGDVRQCLVALSEASEDLRNLFNYRYPRGTNWAGHSFGNLFISTVEMTTNNFGDAVKLASKVLNIRGKVVPITLTNCQLSMKLRGETVRGQYAIETTDFHGKRDRPEFWLEPKAKINSDARQAIDEADLIVLAPGNLYGSLIPTLLVDGVVEGLRDTKAVISYVCNLVNKPNQTENFAVHDYVLELERFTGKNVIDSVLYNIDKPTSKQLEKYALDGEFPVNIDEAELSNRYYKAKGGKFLDSEGAKRDANDTLLHRSLIRHDANTVADELLSLI